MDQKKIGVGIIGASPGRSWAVISHIPAIQALPDIDVVAVSTSRMESAEETARTFGIDRAYDNHLALVRDPAVDLVVVAVKVPTHLELVTAAIEAGKHVYCEWPLGNGTQEGEALLALAEKAGVRHFIGLQSRFTPEVNHLRQLIAEGYVGRVMSVSLTGPAGAWGPYIDSPNLYLLDRANGATLLSIPGGHLIDACRYVAGEPQGIKSATAALRTSALVVDTGETATMNVDDQIAFVAHLDGGAVLSVHLHGGAGGGGLGWEINGSDGDLLLTAPSAHVGMVETVITGSQGGELQPLALPTSAGDDLPAGPAGHVGRLYAAISADIRDGGSRAPTFATAVDLHRLLDSIERGGGQA